MIALGAGTSPTMCDMSFPRALVAATLLVGLGACGGSSSARGGAEEDPFMRDAEAACADFNEVVPDEEPKYADVSQLISQTKKVLSQYETTVGMLSALTYPAESPGAELRRILVVENQTQLEELRAATAQLEAAVASKNEAEYYKAADRFVALSKSPGPDTKGVLNAYGLKECDRAFGPKQ